jgi:hypothetical protein
MATAHNCTCRANGHSYKQGQILCILGKLARCEMNLNNSSWKIIEPICPEASVWRLPQMSAALITVSPRRR